MKTIKLLLFATAACLLSACGKQTVTIITSPEASKRVLFGAEQLQNTLAQAGYRVTVLHGDTAAFAAQSDGKSIYLTEVNDTTLKKEGFHITTEANRTIVAGRDGSGVIYGCRELIDHVTDKQNLDFPQELKDAPEMVLRGACVGLQKTTWLPGRGVYEYPYTPEDFPWFYDKAQWVDYLDMLVANRMNSLYLWNGHPFASLVKLKEYPFAIEVDDATFKKNEEMFSFLTEEADKRGIFVIQMFYNILLSKPFAEHYGLKTQDRNRPITPLVADYTRKSVAAFIEKYPNVGLLVCLGEAMATVEDDVQWFTETIIPGVKDGLQALGRTDEPPLLLRAHDTDCKLVMDAALPLYKNLYTMHKYNGESLTTYEPRGPWSKIHTDLSSLGSIHISNVHILANLEPFRWGSPDFVQKTVQAMHNVHGANALHLYPQASYWDWPYTADKLPNGQRQKQLERDWMWYKTWGRYAWNCHRERAAEVIYWKEQLADYYGISSADAATGILEAYEQSGEIAPKLLRRFGITEGNRQTLLLGMFMSQLVNPYKYTIYPGFYESCGPEGKKLIECFPQCFPHGEASTGDGDKVYEMPMDIIAQAIAHGDKAVEAIEGAASKVTRNKEEFARLQNDMHCYREFAYAFNLKVQAAKAVLEYQGDKNLARLDEVIPLMEQSLEHYRKLVTLTEEHYLYANSMQTSQRRIPIGGDEGKNKTWKEMLVHYEKELTNYRANLAMLKEKSKASALNGTASQGETQATAAAITALPVVSLKEMSFVAPSRVAKTKLTEGATLFTNLSDKSVEALAPELQGLAAYCFDGDRQREEGTTIEFSCEKPVKLLVGYFRDDQKKYAKAPVLETDASANDYGQAEPVLTNAIRIKGLPLANVHAYSFTAGEHKLLLPKGYVLVLGFTEGNIATRNAGLAGAEETMDWMFY